MSVAKVLRLDEYRDRRTHRLRLAEALHRVEPLRHAVFSHLVRIADLCGADRVATVWVDEYGTGLIHPHVVLDQLSDRPRRHFSMEPLIEAWDLGVPSVFDRPSAANGALPATFAVSLGSDGTRAWFLVSESVRPRPLLDGRIRDRIMFLAGECASIVLHRDLDWTGRRHERRMSTGFAGWQILEDLEGREDDEAMSARIARRFVVARLVRMLVDDELIVAPDRIAEQVRRARAEVEGHPEATDAETEKWWSVLDALESGSLEELAGEVVGLGDAVEAQGHGSGALELYRCGYEIAMAIGAPRPCADAARLSGRLLRRQAAWEDARKWFELTREVADAAGLSDVAVKALVGLGGIKKETGNLPAAREAFGAALGVAEKFGDRDAIALVHHGLLGVEHAAGNVAKGLEHGWVAVANYQDQVGKVRCLASLAGALADFGDRQAAEDAWTVVAHTTTEKYYRVYAHDALAHLAALRGDAETFETEARSCDALGWEAEMSSAKAEILYYRGLSHEALGEVREARRWLERAVAFAEGNGFNQVLFKAEAALDALERTEVAKRDSAPIPTAPREVREGLRAMRRELVGAGAC